MAWPNMINWNTGIASTMARARGSRRIWMNSLRMIARMRPNIASSSHLGRTVT
jgi:hypothetical protein